MILAESEQGRGILGVIDGSHTQGLEDADGVAWRTGFLRRLVTRLVEGCSVQSPRDVVQFHPLGTWPNPDENLSVDLAENNEVTECVIKT